MRLKYLPVGKSSSIIVTTSVNITIVFVAVSIAIPRIICPRRV